MSFIPDFSKQPDDLKSLLINVLLLPFWYLAIYLFHKDFYLESDFILMSVVCICLSICSSIITTSYMSHILKIKDSVLLDLDIMIPSVIIQITLTALLIFICYMCDVIFDCRILFYGFVSIYFGFSIFIFTVVEFKKIK